MNAPASHHHDKSLFGKSMFSFTSGYPADGTALQVLTHVLTHGGGLPAPQAMEALAPWDRALFGVIAQSPNLLLLPPGTPDLDPAQQRHTVHAYVSSLGRLHLRETPPPDADAPELLEHHALGVLHLPHTGWEAARAVHAAWRDHEAVAMALLRADLRRLDDAQAQALLDHVIDHVQHVESVCFYVGDECLTKLDRSESLITTKAGPGYLDSLRGTAHTQWDDKACLVTMALRALFLSGRAVRFEEINGLTLSATLLLSTLRRLCGMYQDCGVQASRSLDDGVLAFAQSIRTMSLAVQPPYLRHRWIYALNFLKTERIHPMRGQAPEAQPPMAELEPLRRLLGVPAFDGHGEADEIAWFRALGSAALEAGSDDLAEWPRPGAATSWHEVLTQEVVASAVRATQSDYGMSSSLRDLGGIVGHDYARAVDHVNALSTKDFYTCFVSTGFERHLSPELATMIASTVQKRMMFNRWHFVPANLEEADIDDRRHWYYQPVIPDLAEHSDVHREAHARAAVKYSIRSPGPDMSRPPLVLGPLACRGFYDVRVVRMQGRPFDVQDMLRTRRRTLWLEGLFSALADHLSRPGARHCVAGFHPGHFLDVDLDVDPHASAAAAAAEHVVLHP